jgi:hypothetical protein
MAAAGVQGARSQEKKTVILLLVPGKNIVLIVHSGERRF